MTTAELATAARDGDVDAFTELVKRYQTMAFGYALATLSDHHLAEDAVQIAFLTAYRHLGSLRDPARFGGWLRGIVRFECLRLIRERGRPPSMPMDLEAIAASSSEGSLEDQAIAAATCDQVQHLLGQLPERQLLVATLYYLQDHSQATVAEFLGLPTSTVNNRLREARQFLRHHGAHLMNDPSPRTPDLSATIGDVLRSDGTTIDARLRSDVRPDLLTAVRVATNGRSIGAFIAQYLDDDVARLVILPEAINREPVQPGAGVLSGGVPVTHPIDDTVLGQIVAGSRQQVEHQALESGIKAIDLFAPLVEGGTVAIVGDRNVGKLVLVDELIRRLAPAGHHLTILVFLRTPDETGVMQLLECRTIGPVSVVGIPVADASPAALASTLAQVDTVLVMSRELGRQRYYPAIDPLTSWSTFGQEDEVATGTRQLLAAGDATDPRVVAIRSYLTQPFHVAKPYTHRPGVSVPVDVARTDLATLLEGDPQAFAGLDLFMQGSLADATLAN